MDGQSIFRETIVKVVRALVPARVEVLVKLSDLGQLETAEELVHCSHYRWMRVECATRKTNVRRVIFMVAFHQLAPAADHANRQTTTKRLAIGHEISPHA